MASRRIISLTVLASCLTVALSVGGCSMETTTAQDEEHARERAAAVRKKVQLSGTGASGAASQPTTQSMPSRPRSAPQ